MRIGLISVALLSIPVFACAQSKPVVSPQSKAVAPSGPVAESQGADHLSKASGPQNGVAAAPGKAVSFANGQSAALPSLRDRLAEGLRSAGNLAAPHRAWNLQQSADNEPCGHIIVYQAPPAEEFASMGPQPRQRFLNNVPLENFDDAIRMRAMPPCPQDVQQYGSRSSELPAVPVSPR